MTKTSALAQYLIENLQLSEQEAVRQADRCPRQPVDKQQMLLRSGEICRHIYFVETGLLRMYSTDRNGKEHIIQFAPENWLMSDRSSLYFNEKSEYYIEAVENSEVVALESDFFTSIIDIDARLARNNDTLLQKHIRGLQNRVHSLLAESAEERYMDFMETYPELLQRVPQWMIASYLGITPESLSRVRKELARKNFKVI